MRTSRLLLPLLATLAVLPACDALDFADGGTVRLTADVTLASGARAANVPVRVERTLASWSLGSNAPRTETVETVWTGRTDARGQLRADVRTETYSTPYVTLYVTDPATGLERAFGPHYPDCGEQRENCPLHLSVSLQP